MHFGIFGGSKQNGAKVGAEVMDNVYSFSKIFFLNLEREISFTFNALGKVTSASNSASRVFLG